MVTSCLRIDMGLEPLPSSPEGAVVIALQGTTGLRCLSHDLTDCARCGTLASDPAYTLYRYKGSFMSVDDRREPPNSHGRPSDLLLVLTGELAILVLLRLHEAETLRDLILVPALAISGAVALYILTLVAISISKRLRDLR